jgi:NTE family protein
VQSSPAKNVNLALQGGGAHGAFVWGVVDHLLENGRLGIEAISATSAGAMNAVALASGMATGGPACARQKLHDFWFEVSRLDQMLDLFAPLNQWIQALKLPPEYHPFHAIIHTLTHTLPPGLLNPLNVNPLRGVLEKVVDFDRLNTSAEAPQLFLNATNVRNGKIKVFQTPSITADAVLASACLPMLFQAVEIDGEHYWDGGYMGNPALYPLIYSCESRDILIVQINPIERPDVPKSAFEILNRMNEVSFNSSLMREMRVIAFITKLIDDKSIVDESRRRMLIHAISADDITTKLDVASTFNADWQFLTGLRDHGRRVADAWIAANFDRLGKETTVDVSRIYL